MAEEPGEQEEVPLVARAAARPTTTAAPAEERAGMDVLCVLDVSGSMMGQKIQLLKEAMMFVVDELGPKDRLSITSFNHQGTRLTPLVRMGPEGRDAAKVATTRLTADGGTDIASGLRQALKTLEQRRERNPVAAVFLLTDGQDGGCRYHVEELVRRCRACGAALYTFGFGADHDARLLGTFAEAAQTPFTFVEAPEAIHAAFAGALGGLMSVVAQNARVRIECLNGTTLEKVHTGFHTAPLRPGEEDAARLGAIVEIPDLFAGERKDLLVELKVPQLPEGAAEPAGSSPAERNLILRVLMRYHDLAQRMTVQAAPEFLALERRPGDEQQPEVEPDEEVVDHRHRVEVTNALAAAIGLCGQGEFENAREQLAGCKRKLEASTAKRKDKRKSPMTEVLETELEDAEQRVSSSSAFQRGGCAEMMDAMQMHKQQRCTNMTPNFSVASHSKGKKMACKAMYIRERQLESIQKSERAAPSASASSSFF